MIIVISGPQGSGKSTLANELIKMFGPCGALKQRFAQPLYEMHHACRSVLARYKVEGYNYDQKDGDLLQLLGTEWGRKTIRDSIWIECIHTAIKNAPKNIVHIIEDCRFRNEFDSFNNMPEVLRIRLAAPEHVRKVRAESWRENTSHASEIDLNQYAENGKFDMYFQTDIEPVNEIVMKVMMKVSQIRAQRESLLEGSEL